MDLYLILGRMESKLDGNTRVLSEVNHRVTALEVRENERVGSERANARIAGVVRWGAVFLLTLGATLAAIWTSIKGGTA